MSHPTIKFHEGRSANCAADSSAVTMPPSGPSPGQRSAMQGTPAAAYFSGAPMTATDRVSPLTSAHNRAISVSRRKVTSALSCPKRELAPPANTKPAQFPALVTRQRSRFALFRRLASRPSNAQLAQFFLQALAVQPDRRRGSGNIPSMAHQLFSQAGHFKLVLGFSEVFFAQSGIDTVRRRFVRDRLAARHF